MVILIYTGGVKKYMKKSEDILIGTYNVARYDDEAIITDEMVKRIKG